MLKSLINLNGKFTALAMGLILILSVGTLRAAEDYSTWAHTRKVVLNTSPDGANVAANVKTFPLLIRLTKPAFPFAEAAKNGQDLRFAKASGAHLSYQIERWDSAAGQAVVWVKMDTVYGNLKTQSISMFWGKAVAIDSSNGNAVFDSANGYVATWHFGETGKNPRANSVAGGLPATPVNYDGDESRMGMIGMADSLDGVDTAGGGDFLNLGTGYADFSTGFTYSVWAYPTAVQQYSRLLDLGNGQYADNITFFRYNYNSDISAEYFNAGASGGLVNVTGALDLNIWQQFVMTINGTTISVYKDGALIGNGVSTQVLRNITRTKNYLGKSNWTDSYFKGKYDEAELSKVARSADWIRLTYANQKLAQTMITFVNTIDTTPIPTCTIIFGAPADTMVSEHSSIVLKGKAGCATGYSWSIVSGPAPRILDPEVKDLQVFLPRVTADTSIVYRFTGHFPNGDQTKDVKVTLKEAIPDPVFSLPPTIDWNGKDSLVIQPTITNLATIKATGDSVINFSWTVMGGAVDTLMSVNGLTFISTASPGPFQVKLCLDNGGVVNCKSTTISISIPVSVKKLNQLRQKIVVGKDHQIFDTRGRRIPVSMRK